MQPISLDDAARAMGSLLSGELSGEFSSVCTDTREGASGSLFFALCGENSDGHQYAAQAAADGAVGLVVDHELARISIPQLIVPDTLKALGELARYYRSRFDIPVVAVTGSVGKTSTKEMIATVLGSKFCVLTSRKNFNNEIGVPKTLFELGPEHSAAVVELAMRGPGQIDWLAEIARPQIGVITNIGLSHVELLGSREGLADAKAELLDHLPTDGAAILNADDDFVDFLRDRCPCRVVTFGVKRPADYRAVDLHFAPDGTSRFTVNGASIMLNAPGVHHVINACAACAVADALGISLPDTAASLAEFKTPAMRMESINRADGTTILNDTYNAAPDSMRSALETLRLLAGGRRTVAVLGDMRELGDFSEEAHRYVGEVAGDSDLDLLITVGTGAMQIAAAAERELTPDHVVSSPDTETAVREVPTLVQPGDIVLVKGSRAMEMEKIVRALVDSRPA